jgi:hypothetical protein
MVATKLRWRASSVAALAASAGVVVHATTHNWGWGAFVLAPLCLGATILDAVLAGFAMRASETAAARTFVLAAAAAGFAAWWGATHASGC